MPPRRENEEAETVQHGGDIRPNPDPSRLTTSQLRHDLDALKELLDAKLAAVNHRVDALAQADDKVRALVEALVQEKLVGLRDLHREKFESVRTQFDLVERQRVEQKKDTKDAVDAALQAAKEAVREQAVANGLAFTKSETSTTKQIDAQALNITNTGKTLDDKITNATKATDDKFDDIKGRVGLIEGRGSGFSSSWGVFVAAATIVVAVTSVVTAILISHR